jgi:hypothetical protein
MIREEDSVRELTTSRLNFAGGDQPQVHRHLVQVRTRPLPDGGREVQVHGPAQEGPGQGGRRRRPGQVNCVVRDYTQSVVQWAI